MFDRINTEHSCMLFDTPRIRLSFVKVKRLQFDQNFKPLRSDEDEQFKHLSRANSAPQITQEIFKILFDTQTFLLITSTSFHLRTFFHACWERENLKWKSEWVLVSCGWHIGSFMISFDVLIRFACSEIQLKGGRFFPFWSLMEEFVLDPQANYDFFS